MQEAQAQVFTTFVVVTALIVGVMMICWSIYG